MRIVPKDTIQGAALATVMKQDGCTKVAMANDKEVYGAGLARNIDNSAKEQQLDIIFNEGIDTKAPNYRSLASRAKGQGADCFVFSGITSNNGVQIFKDFARGAAARRSSTVRTAPPRRGSPTRRRAASPPASRPGQVDRGHARPGELPEEGKKFFADYEAEYGEKNPNPYSIYGYEAMSLALDAIGRSGTGKSEDIVKALFATKNRESVLGTYSIDENGDTTLTDYGVYTIKDGSRSFLEDDQGRRLTADVRMGAGR